MLENHEILPNDCLYSIGATKDQKMAYVRKHSRLDKEDSELYRSRAFHKVQLCDLASFLPEDVYQQYLKKQERKQENIRIQQEIQNEKKRLDELYNQDWEEELFAAKQKILPALIQEIQRVEEKYGYRATTVSLHAKEMYDNIDRNTFQILAVGRHNQRVIQQMSLEKLETARKLLNQHRFARLPGRIVFDETDIAYFTQEVLNHESSWIALVTKNIHDIEPDLHRALNYKIPPEMKQEKWRDVYYRHLDVACRAFHNAMTLEDESLSPKELDHLEYWLGKKGPTARLPGRFKFMDHEDMIRYMKFVALRLLRNLRAAEPVNFMDARNWLERQAHKHK